MLHPPHALGLARGCHDGRGAPAGGILLIVRVLLVHSAIFMTGGVFVVSVLVLLGYGKAACDDTCHSLRVVWYRVLG